MPLPPHPSQKSNPLVWLAVPVLLAVGGYIAWREWPRLPVPPVAAPAPEPATAAPRAEAPTGPRYPWPPAATAAEPPLAGRLDDSDPAMRELVAALIGGDAFDRQVEPAQLARRLVAMLDNLPRARLPAAVVPFKRPSGAFAVRGDGDTLEVDPRNFARYAPLVDTAAALDTARVAAAYRRAYPLLDTAYRDLGYPNGHLNDRVVDVIDDLLATPEVVGPIRLVQPRVLYEFADPALEARSSGQKLLLRMGPDNAGKLKRKLAQLRQALVAGPAHTP